MTFRVAALLGMTVEELRGRMTAGEFAEWCAFYELEPWGYAADSYLARLNCSVTANYSGRSAREMRPGDFKDQGRAAGAPPRPKQTPEEMAAVLRTIPGVREVSADGD